MPKQLALRSWLCLLLRVLAGAPAFAVKLRVHTTECVHQDIAEPNSLVSVVLVSGKDETVPVYYDFAANDPAGNVIFSKLEQNDAELAFKTRAPGRHAFCLTLSKASAGRASRASRLVQLDILVGTVYEHDKITDEHLDDMMADISALSERVQKLLSEMRRFKYREARHRRTVESTDRRVRRYAIAKLAIVALIAVCQPLILSQFFKERL